MVKAHVLGAQVVLARGRRRAEGREGEACEAHRLRDGVRALQCSMHINSAASQASLFLRRDAKCVKIITP